MLSKPNFLVRKIILFMPKNKESIKIQNDNIVILDENKKIKAQYFASKIQIIFIIGGFSISTGLIEKSKKYGFSICFLTAGFKFYQMISNGICGNTYLIHKQYTTNHSLSIAKKIIQNKINNQIETLRKTRAKSNLLLAKSLKEYLPKLNKVAELNQIMGIEGNVSKAYFKGVFSDLNWQGRVPRAKHDKYNLLLDIGYTVLFNYIESICVHFGFDIYKGNLHQEFYKRKSLICDLIEPFRPIVDYKLKVLHNLNQIHDENFIIVKDTMYQINYKSKTNYTVEFLKEINQYSESIFLYIRSYYRCFVKDDLENFPNAELIKNKGD